MKCPKCNGVKVKKIVYGMPDFENFDFEKYEVGGCTGGDEGPTHWCVDCSEGFRKSSNAKRLYTQMDTLG